MLGRLLVLVVVSLLAFSLCVGTTVHRRASTLQDDIASLEQEWRAWTAAVAERPPVRGAGSDGNAWLDYAAIDLRHDEMPPWPRDRTVPIAAPSPRLLAALAHLRDGAQRRRVARPRLDNRPLPAIETRRAVSLAVRFAAHEAHFVDAVDYSLDLAWFGADLARTGHGLSTVVLLSAFSDLADLLAHCPEQVGPRLRAVLRRLDECWPGQDGDLLSHMLWAARWIDGEGARPGPGWPGGLHFWVRRPLYLLDARAMRGQVRRNQAAADAPWPQALRMLAADPAAGSASDWLGLGNPIWSPQDTWIELRRRAQTMLRLLLFAVTPESAPVDPFGDGRATLRTRREADRLLFWSVGPDGVDDGGHADPGAEGLLCSQLVKRLPDIVLVLPAR